jgi:Short C-terminal domain
MPGLLRGVARTAVIAGTATSVSNRVSRRQARRWGAEEAAQDPGPPQTGYAQAPPPAPAPDVDPITRLRELGELHDSGVLTDEEFTSAKRQILG